MSKKNKTIKVVKSINSFDLDDKNQFKASLFTIFLFIFLSNVLSALYNRIIDCDEPMNYWEPTHYLMYGHGLQTWEYSPIYALRSYCYLLIHSIAGKILEPISQGDKVVLYYLIKIFIGFKCALAQTVFIAGIRKYFGNKISFFTFIFMIFSAGSFLSTTTYLPTTFSMTMIMFAYGFWMLDKPLLSVFMCATSVFLGWPFVIVLCIPIALDLLYRYGLIKLILWAIIPCITILTPMMIIDKEYYGQWVLAIWNIIAYNFTSSHSGGSQLYGIEEWTFYFINCFVNFNIAFPLSLLTVPILLFMTILLKPVYRGTIQNTWKSLLIISPFYLWFSFMTYLPHKEERFLFVVYPFICLTSSISIYLLINLFKQLTNNNNNLLNSKKNDDHQTTNQQQQVISGFKGFIKSILKPIQFIIIIIFILLSISRIYSTFRNYTGSVDTYTHLYEQVLLRGDTSNQSFPKIKFLDKQDNRTVHICVGKEWYRYPSHFFLPSETTTSNDGQIIKFEMAFLKSNFKGHLPKPFTGTSNIPTNMNDRNQEELDRYIEVDRCHYIIDFDYPSQIEPHYTEDSRFKSIYSTLFLDASNSSSLARAFYIPYYSFKHTKFNHYHLLQNLNLINNNK